MTPTLAILVGVLYGSGVYLMLRRSIVRLIIGLGLLGHAANLLIFTAGRLRHEAPLIASDATGLVGSFADPVPQALILTAIVIGFGVTAFAIVLIKRTADTVGSDDVNAVRTTEG